MNISMLVDDFLQENEFVDKTKDHLKNNWKKYATAAAIGGGLGMTAAALHNKSRQTKIDRTLDNSKKEIMRNFQARPNFSQIPDEAKEKVYTFINGLKLNDDQMAEIGGPKMDVNKRAMHGLVGGVGTAAAINLYKYLKGRKKESS